MKLASYLLYVKYILHVYLKQLNAFMILS